MNIELVDLGIEVSQYFQGFSAPTGKRAYVGSGNTKWGLLKTPSRVQRRMIMYYQSWQLLLLVTVGLMCVSAISLIAMDSRKEIVRIVRHITMWHCSYL